MAQLTIVYWRDIPAQVIVKQGRKSAKRELAKRFIEAIDMCAMRSGAAQTDAYLEEWRRGEPQTIEGDLEAAAQAQADHLEATYDKQRLKLLIDNQGRENGGGP